MRDQREALLLFVVVLAVTAALIMAASTVQVTWDHSDRLDALEAQATEEVRE